MGMKKISRCATLVGLASVALGLAAPAAMGHIPEPVSWQPLPLQLRVLQPGDVPGLSPFGALRFLTPGAGAPESILSARPGFLAAAIERLASAGSVRAVDVVAAFDSERGARDQVDLWRVSKRMSRPLAVIPGAVGVFDRSSAGIAFADGRFAYLLEERWQRTAADVRSQLLGAATEIYARVHGHPLG